MPKKITISPPKPSLLEQAYLLPPPRQPTNWFSRLSPEQKQEVEELLRAKVAGRIQATSRQISDLLKEHGIDASVSKVERATRELAK